MAVCVFVFTAWYIQEMKSDIQSIATLKIAEQEKVLTTLAEVTDRDGADSVVEKIIQDCSSENRARFDTQLSRLPELRGAELVEMEQLFNACGNFFAERKAVMVARLKREYEVYLDLISILALVDSKEATLRYDTKTWGNLVLLEDERSVLSTKLVTIQGDIIRQLKLGTPLSSDTMQSTLVDGQKTKDTLIQLSERIDVVRQSLLEI